MSSEIVLLIVSIVVIIMILCFVFGLARIKHNPVAPIDVRNLAKVSDNPDMARNRVLYSNYLIGGPDNREMVATGYAGNIGAHMENIGKYGGGGHPNEELAYNKFNDCRKLRVLWLEGENGKLYPWDVFPQGSSYRADRVEQDCELAKLLEGKRDRMTPLFVPDHVKKTG